MKNQKDKKSKKGGKRSVIPSFLTKLYQILEVNFFKYRPMSLLILLSGVTMESLLLLKI
jgi:hypothetical protein